MNKCAEDFYFEEYRSVPAQLLIYRAAIEADPALSHRVRQKATPNRWERNLRTFLGAYCSVTAKACFVMLDSYSLLLSHNSPSLDLTLSISSTNASHDT
jgi:hypothetical protein